jgi:hypothetical protein
MVGPQDGVTGKAAGSQQLNFGPCCSMKHPSNETDHHSRE